MAAAGSLWQRQKRLENATLKAYKSARSREICSIVGCRAAALGPSVAATP
jgi:hypothetical protein